MDRLLSYSFALILIYVFALWSPASIHGVILIAVIASFIICSIAFVFGWLTLDGAAAAIVIGTLTFGLGGWPTAVALIFFFLSSTILSINTQSPENYYKSEEAQNSRRNGLQVWANGFWLVVWLLAGILTNLFVCWMAAIAVLAVATADTWATELGSRRFNTKTYLATTFNKVAAGTEGGISWPGVLASLGGSLSIALVALFGFALSVGWFFCIAIAGFLGSVADSYIGAKFQGTIHTVELSVFNWQKQIHIDNNAVNWTATGVGSLVLIILNQIFI